MPERTLEYRPRGMNMWDTWGLEHAGRMHLFHLQRLEHESPRPQPEEDWLGHAVSTDLLHWQEQPLALGPNAPGTLDDLQPWTGCVLGHQGTFYMYYTMRASADLSNGQRIGLATSRDLTHWQRHPGNPVIEPDPRYYVSHAKPLPPGAVSPKDLPRVPGVVDCRDLFVVPDPQGRGWLGFYAARVPAEEGPEGAVVATVRSDDLVHWQHLPPAFVPRKYNSIEVPDVFCLEGRWFLTCLTGNQYGNRGLFSDRYATRGTIYAVADRPEGPYREIEGDTVLMCGDAQCGYSCRSFLFQGERNVLYTQSPAHWVATLSPPMLLRATPDGRLRMAYSPRVQGWRTRTLVEVGQTPPVQRLPYCHPQWNVSGGEWRIEGGAYWGQSRTGWQIADLGPGAPSVEAEARVTLQRGTAAGLALRANTNSVWAGGDLVIALDAAEGCVFVARTQEFEEIYKRQCAVRLGQAYHLRVCQRGQRMEVFVDDILQLQVTVQKHDRPSPGLGLFVDRAETSVTGLAAYALADPAP